MLNSAQTITNGRLLCHFTRALTYILKAVAVELKDEFKSLTTVIGIGPILGLTIMLETGDINRFAGPGNYASYCR
jgi:hypothetical protein